MSNKVFEIAFKLGAKLDPSVQKNFNAASQQLGKMQKGIGNVIKTGAKMAAGMAALGAAGIAAGVAMSNKFADTTDRIDKMSQKLGMSRQGFQEWDFIMSQAGMSIDKMQVGMKTLATRMDEAANGTGKGADLLKKLQVDAVDPLTGSLKTQEEVFEETVKALQSMPDGTEKSRIAMELFGKAGQDMIPLLNSSSESVDELKEKAHELGLVIGDDAIDAGVLWADTMDQAKRAMGGLFNVVASNVLPIMQRFLEYGMSHLPKLQKILNQAFERAGPILSGIGRVGLNTFQTIKGAVQDNQPTFQRLQDVAKELGGFIQGAFEAAQPYITWFANEGIPKAVDVLAGLLDGAVNTYNFIKDNWSWIAPIVGGITAALLTYRAVTQSIILVKGALAAAQIAWNIAMSANPIGLIILGIGALIGIGIALWKNWDSISAWFGEMWQKFISWVSPVGTAISDTFTGAYNAVTGLFSGLGSWFSGVLNSVTGAFRGGVNSIISMANSAINSLNRISVSVPDWVPGVGGKTFGVNIPNIPMLAQGGITTGATLAMIGEGSEQEAVLPLSKLQSLLDDPSGDGGTTHNNSDTDNDYTFVYSPNINVEGNADQEALKQALGMSYAEFKRFMDRYLSERKRLSFNN